MKKSPILSLILALAMMLSIFVPAWTVADDDAVANETTVSEEDKAAEEEAAKKAEEEAAKKAAEEEAKKKAEEEAAKKAAEEEAAKKAAEEEAAKKAAEEAAKKAAEEEAAKKAAEEEAAKKAAEEEARKKAEEEAAKKAAEEEAKKKAEEEAAKKAAEEEAAKKAAEEEAAKKAAEEEAAKKAAEEEAAKKAAEEEAAKKAAEEEAAKKAAEEEAAKKAAEEEEAAKKAAEEEAAKKAAEEEAAKKAAEEEVAKKAAEEEEAAKKAAEEEAARLAEEEAAKAHFKEGLVYINKKTDVYAAKDLKVKSGTFTAKSVVYAENVKEADNKDNDILKITFETEETKKTQVKFQTAYIKAKDVTPLTEEETDKNQETLKKDKTLRTYRKTLLDAVSFKAVEVESVDVKDTKGKVVPNAAISVNVSPATVKVGIGERAVFTATATNATGNVVYQWQYSRDNGKTWVNTTKAAKLSIVASEARYSYLFRCAVTADNGTVNSTTVKMVVPYTVKVSPTTQKVAVGERAIFTATATGAQGNIEYQWQYSKDGGDTWTNTTKAAKLNIVASEARYTYIFRCMVSAENGTVISSNVKMAPPFTIKISPENKKAGIGSRALFTANVTGATGTIKYQWQYSKNSGKSWINMSGKTAESLNAVASEKSYSYQFRCVVTADNGTVNSGICTISKPYTVSATPKYRNIAVGGVAKFTATAPGATGSVKYQWQFSTDKGVTWKDSGMSGNKTDTLSVTVYNTYYGMLFRCEVTAGNGKMRSGYVYIEPIGGTKYTYKENSSGKWIITGYNGTDTALSIPAGHKGRKVISIDANAFKDNTSIKSVIIPQTITTIGASAFEGCTSLTTVTISDKVTSIGTKAFKNCTKLSNMKIVNK